MKRSPHSRLTRRIVRVLRGPAVLAFVWVAALAGPVRAGAAETCYSDWSEAAAIVAKEGLASVEAVTALARPKDGGEIIKVTLCRSGARFVYRLLIRLPAGQHRTATVDAKSPSAP